VAARPWSVKICEIAQFRRVGGVENNNVLNFRLRSIVSHPCDRLRVHGFARGGKGRWMFLFRGIGGIGGRKGGSALNGILGKDNA
jgi:hypothetical protein